MQIHELHAMLYDNMPEGTIINVCELSSDDARLVSDNAALVARALGHTGERLEAALEDDVGYINDDLTARFRALIAEYGEGE